MPPELDPEDDDDDEDEDDVDDPLDPQAATAKLTTAMSAAGASIPSNLFDFRCDMLPPWAEPSPDTAAPRQHYLKQPRR